jgi:hypothetical protein
VAPLNVLLSHALLDLTRCCERAGADQVVLWSNLLRLVGTDGVDRKALPTLARVSRRAMRTIVDAQVRHEWAWVEDGVVRLTDVGNRARDDWGAAIADAEAAWPHGSSLRALLEAFVADLPLEYSLYPCIYGAADWSVTGGPGADWKPVPRDRAGDTVSSISLLALLSQALTGFAAEYESRVDFGLRTGVYFDAAFGDGPVPLADAPAALMIVGNGKSGLERHRKVTVDRSRMVRLTPVGTELRDAYRPTVQAVEAALQHTAALRAVLEALDVHNAGHAAHPDVRYVGGHTGFAEVSDR